MGRWGRSQLFCTTFPEPKKHCEWKPPWFLVNNINFLQRSGTCLQLHPSCSGTFPCCWVWESQAQPKENSWVQLLTSRCRGVLKTGWKLMFQVSWKVREQSTYCIQPSFLRFDTLIYLWEVLLCCWFFLKELAIVWWRVSLAYFFERKQICSHHCEDTRCAVTSLISF